MLLLVSSTLLTVMFFLSGISKISSFSQTSNGLYKKPFFNLMPKFISNLSLLLVIILEIIAPMLIMMAVINPEYNLLAQVSAIGLAIFTILATLLYHFPPNGVEFYFFMKNITIIGGLLSLSMHFI